MSPSSEVTTTLTSKQALRGSVESIVGKPNLREATDRDIVDGVRPQFVVEPGSEAELAAVLKSADEADAKVLPRGAGTKMDWGNRPVAADIILSTQRLNRVLEHAWGDMTATVEAGCTVGKLQRTLAEHGQSLAIDPLWPEQSTIGGILATNDSGSLRVRFGSLRDLIIGITLVLPDGTIAKSGGRVVKNVAGYDLPKLVTGALGTLGMVTTAVFRLHPLPTETRSLTIGGTSNAALQKLATAIHDSQLAYTGLQFRVDSSGVAKLDIRFEGTPAGIAALGKQLRAMCTGMGIDSTSADVWKSREALFPFTENSVTAKFSVLPAQMGNFFDAVSRLVEKRCDWKIIAQSVGVGLIYLSSPDAKTIPQTLSKLRDEIEKLSTLGQMSGGSLVVLRCPLAMKSQFDVWGPPSDAQRLFVNVKRHFDARGTLNPGRFIGGI
jgi:glycolate oxidase FAD binding subunit